MRLILVDLVNTVLRKFNEVVFDLVLSKSDSFAKDIEFYGQKLVYNFLLLVIDHVLNFIVIVLRTI